MKLLRICAILLLPAIAGCMESQTYFYHPDKTLEQAKADCETCHEALIRATSGGTVADNDAYFESLNRAGDKCMQDKGYSMLSKGKLPEGARTTPIYPRLLNHSVAGK